MTKIIANRRDLYRDAAENGENCYSDIDIASGSWRYHSETTDDVGVYVTHEGDVWLCNDSGHVKL